MISKNNHLNIIYKIIKRGYENGKKNKTSFRKRSNVINVSG